MAKEEKKVLRKTKYEDDKGNVKVIIVYSDFSSEEVIDTIEPPKKDK